MISKYNLELKSISKLNFSFLNEKRIKEKTFKYGLAFAYLKNNQTKKARKISSELLKENPNKIIYNLLDIEIDISEKEYTKAEKKLLQLYSITPDNYPISMLLGKTLHHNKKFGSAAEIFLKQAKKRPNQINIWYQAAESQGLAGDISGYIYQEESFFS